MDILMQIFPGIFTLFDDPLIGAVRVALILLGFVLAFYGFKGKLEPLIMVPMGLGMIAVNAGVLFLGDGSTGTLIIDPLVSETDDLMQAIQVNFLQPIYNFTFSNNLIACLVFMGIGARSEIVEGVVVEENSVISMGVFIGQSTKIYDRTTGEIHRGRVPAGSVVVPGSLPSADGKYNLNCAVIVKRVDAKTRSKTSINELLRD